MLPVIFKIGNYSVSGYLFFYTLGLFVGSLVIFLFSRKEKLDSIEMINYIIFLIISVLLGSKIYSLFYTFLTRPEYYKENLKELFYSFFNGGIFYGGLLFGILFSYFYVKKYFRGDEWRVLDLVGMGAAIGHSIGRLGCFCAGCCYGIPTTLPWGVKFHYLGGKPHPFREIPVHPTQLYESFLNLINFIILLYIYKRKKFNGQVGLLYLINYGIIRFFLEYIRNDGGRGYLIKGSSRLTSLSYPQLISFLIVVISLFIYNKRLKK